MPADTGPGLGAPAIEPASAAPSRSPGRYSGGYTPHPKRTSRQYVDSPSAPLQTGDASDHWHMALARRMMNLSHQPFRSPALVAHIRYAYGPSADDGSAASAAARPDARSGRSP